MSLLEAISLFPNPNTPDLGCFIRRKHEFLTDPGVDFLNVHVELCPSIDFSPSHHQAYFRVACGEASFFQRCLVYATPDASLPPPVLQNLPPGFILGGDYRPYPSDWQRFPTHSGQQLYWFFGQHRNPAEQVWKADALVGHSYDIYENGTLSIVRYDDAGGDRDFDDLVLEVAIVGRRSWRDVIQAADQATIHRSLQKQGIPKLKERLKERDKALKAKK